MLSLFNKNKEPTGFKQAQLIYERIVEQARQPWVFKEFCLPDTVQGRFESLAVHLFIVLRVLKVNADSMAKSISQELCNAFVADIEHSLRDVRLSESKVNKQIKKFVEGFYGRLIAYDVAIDQEHTQSLLDSIFKNIYDHQEQFSPQAKKFVVYIEQQLHFIQQQGLNNLNFTTVKGV